MNQIRCPAWDLHHARYVVATTMDIKATEKIDATLEGHFVEGKQKESRQEPENHGGLM